MSRLSWLQKIYWTRFSKPATERALIKFLIEQPVSSILEIGVGDGTRMQRIAKLVQSESSNDPVRYIGVDEFEASPEGRVHLKLKQAHQLSAQLGFKASLMPGAAAQSVMRVAHKFGASDLIIIDGGIDPLNPTLGPIGTWLNRLAHNRSTVIACQKTGESLVVVNRELLDLPLVKAA